MDGQEQLPTLTASLSETLWTTRTLLSSEISTLLDEVRQLFVEGRYHLFLEVCVVDDSGEHYFEDLTNFHPRSAALAVLRGVPGDYKILLIQRGTEPGFGQWSVPGGRRNISKVGWEVGYLAAIRETFEESGVRVEEGDFASEVYGYKYKDSDHRVVVFKANIPHGPLLGRSFELTLGEGILDARWVPLKEASGYDLTLMAKQILPWL
jgi:8-oxo-dGTP diphosphatase